MPTNILCIETATDVCSVALSVDGLCQIEEQLSTGLRHSSGLTQLVSDILKGSQLNLTDINAIAISDGPGSYTGLRVGLSSSKAFCYALDIPLISVPTLDAIAENAKNIISEKSQYQILSTIDARRMEVYCALYDNVLSSLSDTTNLIYSEDSIEHLLSTVSGTLYIVGNGAAKLHKLYVDKGLPKRIKLLPFECSAEHMVQIAYDKYGKSEYSDIAYHTPFYYKSPNITIPKSQL